MGSKGGVRLTTLTNEHLLPLHLLCHGLDTSLTEGMARKRVKELLKETGKNKFSQRGNSVPEKLKNLFSSRSAAPASRPSRWDSMSSVASSSSGESVGSCRSRGSRIYRPSASRPSSMVFSNRWSGDSFGSSSSGSCSRWDSMISLASSSSGKSRRSRSSWGSTTSLSSVGFVSPSASSGRNAFSRSEWKKLFGNRIPESVNVIRDGRDQSIHGKNLVIGDVVRLQQGDIVPADMRIIDSDDVIVDNRLITGMRRERRTHEIDEIYSNPDLLVSPNMLFACTRVLRGQCTAMVLRTGEDTVFGTLKDYAQRVKFTVTRGAPKQPAPAK